MPDYATRKDPLKAYELWRSMLKRCNDPRTNGYHRYGGAGITVDSRWTVYENFIEDMGPRPTSKHQLDRIDNTKGYYKENCQWVSCKENIAKSNRVSYVEWRGERLNKSEWAKRLGLSVSSFCRRLACWPLEKAMSEVHGPTGPKPKRS